MKRVVLAVALLAVSQQAGWGAILISCEGTESGGAGPNRFQYEIQNTGPVPITVSIFSVATSDLNILNYANWVMPVGWNAIVQPLGLWVTPGVKTPHGGISPVPSALSSGQVMFSGPAIGLNAGQTQIFAFDNPLPSENGEWNVTALPAGAATMWPSPVSGGLVQPFTDGPVHVAVPEPASTMLVFASGLLMVSLWRRWQGTR